MPLNKNAMARYRRLDACLKDRSRRYYIKDLIRECSDAIRTSDDPEDLSHLLTVSLFLSISDFDLLRIFFFMTID